MSLIGRLTVAVHLLQVPPPHLPPPGAPSPTPPAPAPPPLPLTPRPPPPPLRRGLRQNFETGGWSAAAARPAAPAADATALVQVLEGKLQLRDDQWALEREELRDALTLVAQQAEVRDAERAYEAAGLRSALGQHRQAVHLLRFQLGRAEDEREVLDDRCGVLEALLAEAKDQRQELAEQLSTHVRLAAQRHADAEAQQAAAEAESDERGRQLARALETADRGQRQARQAEGKAERVEAQLAAACVERGALKERLRSMEAAATSREAELAAAQQDRRCREEQDVAEALASVELVEARAHIEELDDTLRDLKVQKQKLAAELERCRAELAAARQELHDAVEELNLERGEQAHATSKTDEMMARCAAASIVSTPATTTAIAEDSAALDSEQSAAPDDCCECCHQEKRRMQQRLAQTEAELEASRRELAVQREAGAVSVGAGATEREQEVSALALNEHERLAMAAQRAEGELQAARARLASLRAENNDLRKLYSELEEKTARTNTEHAKATAKPRRRPSAAEVDEDGPVYLPPQKRAPAKKAPAKGKANRPPLRPLHTNESTNDEARRPQHEDGYRVDGGKGNVGKGTGMPKAATVAEPSAGGDDRMPVASDSKEGHSTSSAMTVTGDGTKPRSAAAAPEGGRKRKLQPILPAGSGSMTTAASGLLAAAESLLAQPRASTPSLLSNNAIFGHAFKMPRSGSEASIAH
eukprot:SM000168S02597  [mRNA]  locus=s168:87118:90293:+ [translate_table: standard]